MKRINPEKYVFTFGKYAGYPYDYVADIDPQYVIWCHENVKWFCVDDDELIRLQGEVDLFDRHISKETDRKIRKIRAYHQYDDESMREVFERDWKRRNLDEEYDDDDVPF